MKMYVVGNPLVAKDKMPVVLLPKLRERFPDGEFEYVDPAENFIPEEGSIIIDTVEGIDSVQIFLSLDDFELRRSVTPHDYDLGFHLRLLQKLGKISGVTIVGVPGAGDEALIFEQICNVIR